MSLSNLGTAILLPPINLVPLSLAGLLLMRWRRRAGLAVACAGLVALLLLGMPVVADAMLAGLETGLPLQPPAGAPPSAIVLLTAGAIRDDASPVMDVDLVGLERTKAAAALYRRVHLPILVTGGPYAGSLDTLGASMARTLQGDFATPVRWVEPAAIDTAANADLSAVILKESGIRSVYLVTHAWHMRRAVLAFRHTGIAVTAVPVRMDALTATTIEDFYPRPAAWVTSYLAIHEWVGVLYYRLIR